jgi:myo-inositol 2-dehydrogenase/D-chiro-inositol 1-dehydrogenase
MSKADDVGVPCRQSRRQFLVKSGLAAGTSVAAGLAVHRSAHAAGSDTLKIGLIGCGGRGRGAVASALAADRAAKLTAVFDAFRDQAENSRKALKASLAAQVAVDDDHCFSGFDGYRKLLESGVDVALLAEPPHFRPIHIEACIEAGAHVFAEKPMAVDAPGVRRVLAAGDKARQKKLSLVSGFETRYSDAARQAIGRIHAGEIGDVVAVHTTYNTGPLWHRGRKPEWTEMEFQMRNWYYFTWLSGDHLVEQHVHYNDAVCWIMHEEPPLSAWGYGGRQVRTEAKYGDIFDHHSVVYDYPGGVRYFAFTRQQPGCDNENSKIVFGTKGQLRDTRGWELCDLKGKVKWTPARSRKNPEVNCFEEMFAAIRAGKPINDSLAMARSTMHAILGRMATHGGQRVTWEQALASNRVLAPKSYAWDAPPPVLPGKDGQYPYPIPGVTKVL